MNNEKNTAVAKVQESELIESVSNNKLLEMAINANLDIDKLERLVAMKERHESKMAEQEFFKALSGFQSEMKTVGKDKQVNFGAGKTQYKYASIDLILDEARPLLAKWGLSYRFKINDENDKGNITVTCFISHTAGHSEATTMTSKADTSGSKNSIQSQGSAVTYLQRYTLTGALGITTGNDEDGGKMLNTDENWNDKIKGIKDYDKLIDYAKTHAMKDDQTFRNAVAAQIKTIQAV